MSDFTHWSDNGWARLIKTEFPDIKLIERYGYKKVKKEEQNIPNQLWADVTQAWGDFIELYRVGSDGILTDWIWY